MKRILGRIWCTCVMLSKHKCYIELIKLNLLIDTIINSNPFNGRYAKV